jgi:hypothetical protein
MLASVSGGANDDVPEDAWRDPRARQTVAQRKGDAIAALVMHGTLVDRNDPLRSGRVVPHDQRSLSSAEDECDLAAKTGFCRRRNDGRAVHVSRRESFLSLSRKLFRIGTPCSVHPPQSPEVSTNPQAVSSTYTVARLQKTKVLSGFWFR